MQNVHVDNEEKAMLIMNVTRRAVRSVGKLGLFSF